MNQLLSKFSVEYQRILCLLSYSQTFAVFLSDRQGFQVGSLSHMINLKATGYQELPQFPEVAPDPSVRNVEVSLFMSLNCTCQCLLGRGGGGGEAETGLFQFKVNYIFELSVTLCLVAK